MPEPSLKEDINEKKQTFKIVGGFGRLRPLKPPKPLRNTFLQISFFLLYAARSFTAPHKRYTLILSLYYINVNAIFLFFEIN